ncbi:MAG: phosphate ABC transporter substrate-binding protein [Calditrichaeota bacterium]|nr:phosphate ABC transporter substrate-binding protein [Calditrichota bacterium]RQV98320.1 MAG: phosphate ABC transporter substrate-binding protein [Calditrichota bacterium]
MKNLLMIYLTFILILLTTLFCIPPSGKQSPRIRIKGSDTMKILMDRLAEHYMRLHPEIAIYVEAGGTGSGVNALIEEQIDICSASRLLSSTETSKMAQKNQTVGYFTVIAKDALSIYVHPENSITDLTLKQIKQIFTGEIRNWNEIGGPDQEIIVYIRPPNSGTYFYFKEHLLEGEEYFAGAITVPTTSRIVQLVESHLAAIGYGGIAYGGNIIHTQVNGIHSTPDNVRFDLYPISRYLYLLTLKKPRGPVQNFIDWILSGDGQKIVEEIGYISILPSE